MIEKAGIDLTQRDCEILIDALEDYMVSKEGGFSGTDFMKHYPEKYTSILKKLQEAKAKLPQN